jgi:putative holliday junction resolvase
MNRLCHLNRLLQLQIICNKKIMNSTLCRSSTDLVSKTMPNIRTPHEFTAELRPNARLLGLDLGSKTIGLAIATLPLGIATPLKTIQRIRFQLDAQALIDVIKGEGIDALILGLPLNMDGSAGQRVQSTKAFARNLAPLCSKPIMLFDERLTSSDAEDAMIEAGVRYTRRAAMLDAAAARLILQGAIDSLRPVLRGQ